MKALLNTLYNKVKENPEEYFGDGASTWSIQNCNINGFEIKVYFGYEVLLSVEKSGFTLYEVGGAPINYFFGYGAKFRRLVEGIEKRREKCEKMEEELKESMQEQQKKDFIKNGVDTWIKELEGIEVKQGTKEFDEVIRDTNRLQEISKEAQAIYKKYQKSFFN